MLVELVEVFAPGLAYALALYLSGTITAMAAAISILVFFMLGEYYAYKRYARGLEEMKATGEEIERILNIVGSKIDEIRRNCGRDIVKFDNLLSKYPSRE